MTEKNFTSTYDLLQGQRTPELGVKSNINAGQIYTKTFAPMLNGTATNTLAIIGRNAEPTRINPLADNEATIENGDFKVFIEKYSNKKSLKVGVVKLLDLLVVELTKLNHYRAKDPNTLQTTVTFSLDDYMTYLGIENIDNPNTRKDARKRLKEALDTLYSISLEWEEKSGDKVKNYAKMRLCEAQGIKRGIASFTFTTSMAHYLNQSYIMQYPLDLLAIGERNPNAYPIARKLALHHSIDNNHKKGTSNIISVAKLLESAPEIPSIEVVRAGNQSWSDRIKDRLEKALDAIGNTISWEYSNSKGVPLTEKQLAMADYETFSKLYIKFDILGAPDPTQRIEAKKAKTTARRKAKKTDTKKEE
ncbi:RepB family plasmid replication initiator protein [Streptococcus suis]|uniref:RepB family plasmid replication initiator protein n=1 Tax=Streptococcus suis TaxID=1307 RepID=UPI002FCC342B